jgi:protein required for attachment to host cells
MSNRNFSDSKISVGSDATCTEVKHSVTCDEATKAKEQIMNAWILVADACGARLFMTFDNGRFLHLLERFSHAQSRAMEAELVTDRAGSGQSSTHSMPSTKQPHAAHKELEAVEFARVLNDYLLDAAQHNKFDSLVLVMPPHFLGLLRAELSPAVRQLVTATVGKDLTYMDEATIKEHVVKAVWPARQN